MERVKQGDEEKYEDILHILMNCYGAKEDIAYSIYKKILLYRGKEAKVLQFFFEISEDIESSESEDIEKVFSEEERKQFVVKYGKLVDGTLEVLLQTKLKKQDFYAELWKFITESPLLKDDKEKAFALYYLWIDLRIPYYELKPGLRMSNDEYRKLFEEMKDIIKEARFILNVPTEQKTERASRLLYLFNNISDDKHKTFLMAQILNMNTIQGISFSKIIEKERMGKIL